jgi:hypothetical protein
MRGQKREARLRGRRSRVSIYVLEKQFRKRWECRVKPGNDAVIGAALRSCRRNNAGFHTWRDPAL